MKKLLIVFLALSLFACSSDEKLGAIYEKDGIALDGYDPVAYFEQSEPRKGIMEETVEYNGLIYRFTSTKNRKLFQENPQRYLPEYGGWCAYAVAQGPRKMAPDPTLWKVQDGRLLLFYDNWQSKFSKSLLDKWEEEPDLYLRRADINWPKIQE